MCMWGGAGISKINFNSNFKNFWESDLIRAHNNFKWLYFITIKLL